MTVHHLCLGDGGDRGRVWSNTAMDISAGRLWIPAFRRDRVTLFAHAAIGAYALCPYDRGPSLLREVGVHLRARPSV